MPAGFEVAVITVIGTLVVALLAFLTALAARSSSRQAALEARIIALEKRDRKSWLYIRSLINFAYLHTDTTKFPLPEPPEGWLDEIKDE